MRYQVFGETDEGHNTFAISPSTLKRDDSNGVNIRPGHVHNALRKYLGIDTSPITQKFPFHTFIINVLGSFFIGFFLILFTEKFTVNENLRILVLVGFLGAFTTFSTFELGIWLLIKENQFLQAFAYIALCVLVGFAGISAGVLLAKKCC